MRMLWLVAAVVLAVTTADAQIVRRLGRIGPAAEGSPSTPTMTDTSPLTSGTEGVAYTKPFTCTGGTAPYTWTQPTGTLPAGLSLSSAGVLSGTPTVGSSVGVASFGIRCTDSAAMPLTDTETFQLTIGYGSPAFSTSSPLSACSEDMACSRAVACVGGLAPRTYTVISGALPAGMSMDTAGNITGTPTEAGTASFTTQCQDALGATGSKAFQLGVTAAASGECDGAAADDYSTCIAAFDTVVVNSVAMSAKRYGFKSLADIRTWGEWEDESGGIFYDGMGSVDAASVTVGRLNFGITNFSSNHGSGSGRIRIEDPNWSTGEWFMTWEAWKENSFRIASLVCAGHGAIHPQKSWQIDGATNTGTGSQLFWWEVKDLGSIEDNVGADPVVPPQIATITAVAGTATVTTTAPHGFTNGQAVTIAGATNTLDITIASSTTGTSPVLTMSAAHNLTGSMPVDFQGTGELPANNSTPARYYTGTVTGASTIQLVPDLDLNVNSSGALNYTTGATGGFIRTWPYSAYNATITTTGPTTFTYPMNNTTYVTPATGTAIYAIGDLNTQVTGTDCAEISVRLNSSEINSGITRKNQTDGGLEPQNNQFIVPCKTWHKYYWTVRINAGDAWTCGAVTGNYDLVSMWAQNAGDADATVIYYEMQTEMDRVRGDRISPAASNVLMRQGADDGGGIFDDCNDPNYTNIAKDNTGEVRDFYLEQNTSGGSCNGGYVVPKKQYFRNFAFAGSTTTGVIATTPTSIIINGTEVLGLPPIP